MRVIGIDASTTSTGYCVYDNGIVTYGVIQPNKRLEVIDRIINIVDELKSIIKAKSVEYVAIEELSTMRNASTTKVLAYLQGYIEIEMRKKEMLLVKVRPSEWRKDKVKAKHRSEYKQEAINYIKSKYNLDVIDDEADAIMIAEYASGLNILEE